MASYTPCAVNILAANLDDLQDYLDPKKLRRHIFGKNAKERKKYWPSLAKAKTMDDLDYIEYDKIINTLIYGAFFGPDDNYLRNLWLPDPNNTPYILINTDGIGDHLALPAEFRWRMPKNYPRTEEQAKKQLYRLVSRLCTVPYDTFLEHVEYIDQAWDE